MDLKSCGFPISIHSLQSVFVPEARRMARGEKKKLLAGQTGGHVYTGVLRQSLAAACGGKTEREVLISLDSATEMNRDCKRVWPVPHHAKGAERDE